MVDTNWIQLCDDIDDGDYDAGLGEIIKAVASRRDIVARRAARRLMQHLTAGDKVKLTNGIKPRYYEGMVGHVEKLVEGAAVVKLTRMPTAKGAGRPPEGGYKDKLMVPFEWLIKLDPGVKDLNEDDLGPDIGDDSDDDEVEDLED